MSRTLVEKHWDYSLQAPYYQYRPNYSPKAIDMLLTYVGAKEQPNIRAADLGAGTGNLTIMLLERGLLVEAVEPNDAMREFGIQRTSNSNSIRWIKATGTESTLDSGKFDWVCFGSSFNVIDRDLGMKETCRLLKDKGYFSCMWNHRDLADPIQEQAEGIILESVPEYTRGVRREDQRAVIEESGLFTDLLYMEVDFEVPQTRENYIKAWRSVRNKYWDLETDEGQALFRRLVERWEAALPEVFPLKYTTRCWTARKK